MAAESWIRAVASESWIRKPGLGTADSKHWMLKAGIGNLESELIHSSRRVYYKGLTTHAIIPSFFHHSHRQGTNRASHNEIEYASYCFHNIAFLCFRHCNNWRMRWVEPLGARSRHRAIHRLGGQEVTCERSETAPPATNFPDSSR